MYLMKLILLMFWIKYEISGNEEVFLLGDRYCITNGSSAIVFNKEITSTSIDDNESFSFYPKTSDKSYFGCDIDGFCPYINSWTKKTDWNTVSSLEGPVNEYVTDRRWEALPLIKTVSVDEKRKPLIFERSYVSIRNGSSFVIPFSIRGNLDGHMFLCEGTRSPAKSNCYWVMLAAYGGNKSAIRKCPENQIPSQNAIYPQSPCKELMDSNMYKDALDENSWRHFKIIKERSTLTVLRNNENFLKFHDNDFDVFNPATIWLHSKNGAVLWKIHQYEYLYTDIKGVSQLGPPIIINTDTLCISMFVALCHTCSLQLKIKTGKTNVLEETINSTRGMWKEVRVTCDIPQYVQEVSFYPIRDNSLDDKGFWALDDVRLCSENEYRYIKSKESSTRCQRIEIGKDVILTPSKNNEIESQGISCPENSIGQYCVPCRLFDKNHSGYCPNFKYCEIIHGREKCHCSSGYEKDCSTYCSRGTYGHGCQKNCSPYCSKAGGCSYLNGFCVGGCKYQSFTGNMCEIPPEAFIDASPIVYDIEFFEAKLRMDNFEVVGSKDKHLSFIFQFIKDDNQYQNGSQDSDEQSKNSQRKWMDIGNVISLDDMDVITIIDNLEPDTAYRVRAVIINGTENMMKLHENKEFIRSTRWRTLCRELSRDEIRIDPANVTTKVTVEKKKDTCKLWRYHYSIGGEFMFVKDTFDISPLDPDKEYNLTIKNTNNGQTITIIFRTKEGVPSAVRNISYTTSSSELNISWIEPEHKNGDIGYKIRWKFLRKIPCSMIGNSSELSKVSNLTSTSLNNLRPYSTYMITIQAFTTAGLGDPLTVSANTSSNDNLTEKEKIFITSSIPEDNRVDVSLSKINCNDDLEGPIYMRFQVSCVNEWCTSKTIEKSDLYDVNNACVTIYELLPFSNYTVVSKISRDSNDWIETSSGKFQTKPSVPNAITELQAYSKDSISISLRWKPPYPPTGTLEEYLIHYSTKYPFRTKRFQMKVPSGECGCLLWPDYHCADINENLWNAYIYTIEIEARNRKPLNRYGNRSKPIKVEMKDEPSEPPYGVEFSWQENNDLNMSWFHPNVTNGRLSKFEVILTCDGMPQPIRQNLEISEYTLIYHYTIESRIFMACTNYDMTIYSHNNKLPRENISHKIVSPPDIPRDIPKKNIHYNSTTTGITIRLEYHDIRLENYNKNIYVVVSNSEQTEDLLEFTENLRNGKILNLTKSRIVLASIRRNQTEVFTIGQQSQNVSDDANPPLEPGTNYSINLFLVNECHGVVRLTRMQKYMITMGNPKLYDPDNDTGKSGYDDEDVENGGLWALILLVVIPIILIGYWYRKRGTSIIEKAVGTRQDLHVDELPLTDNTTELPPRKINAVKPKKTLPMQVLPPLKTEYSKKIRLVDFVNYVKTAVESGELENQHDLFPRGLLEKHERGSLIQNKTKNRYKNLIAYDHTRVKLKEIPGEEFSDYINANYIDGYRKPRVYIATQGPKNSTLADFWRMIWQENIKNIVMLANIIENGKKKVEQYWPNINEATNFGDIKVRFVSAKVFANFDLRTFEVSYRGEKRGVEQLHFTTWPDHGVPLYAQSLVPFLQRMLKIPYNPSSPILVHCSAGVGRTGTVILCDICLRMAAGENAMDFLAYLENLRKQRSNMVDNMEQYKLAHLVVLECLFGMRTAIPCSKDMEQLVEKVLQNEGVVQQMRYLEETRWQDSAMETILKRNELVYACPEKNRFQEIVPERYRVFLSCYPPDDPTSSYINAVLVDDFSNPGRYIVTQQPMPNTLGDFWRLLIERGCSVIINLNKINSKDKTVCKFWPTNNMPMSLLDFLVIRHVKTKRLECYEITTVLVEIENTQEKLSVDIVSINNWKPGNLLPPNTEEFLTFREAADSLARNSEHVLVTCYDGATASGLYLAMSFLIEKMKLEQECDVCLAVRSIRHSRKHFVTTEEQYEYLFKTSLSFISGFQNYANFD